MSLRKLLPVFIFGIIGSPLLWPAAQTLEDEDIREIINREHARVFDQTDNRKSEIESNDPFIGPKLPEKETDVSPSINRLPREELREQLFTEVQNAWKRPQAVQRETDIRGDFSESRLIEQLEKIRIPRLELNQMPLSQALHTISSLSEEHGDTNSAVNLVLIDPNNADPQVSIVLRQLNLARILEYVVEAAGYTYDVRTDALIVRPRLGPGYGLETDYFPISRSTMIRLTGTLDRESGGIIEDPFSQPIETRQEPLERRQENALKQFFQKAGIPFAEIEGADLALADGQLIVTQTPRNLEKLQSLLRRYSAIKQVEIEARFIEVQDKNLESLGFQWSVLSGGSPAYTSDGVPLLRPDGSQALTGRNRFNAGSARTLAETFSSGQSVSKIVIDRPGLDIPDLIQGPPASPSSLDLGENAGNLAEISGVIGSADINLIIQALERQTGNDLLSAPKVTVLSGKTAEIIVAEEFRYPRSFGDAEADVGRGDSTSGSAGVAITTGTPREFEMRNLGVEMEVTPTVEDNNAISLRLEPKVTEFEGFVEYGGPSIAIASDTTVSVPSGFYQPIFSVRKVKTEVTIWDGATVVMGGLTREQAVQINDRVPILGSIPLLGRLFQSKTESTQKRNLIIFVTASLVSPGGSPAFQKIPGVSPNSLFQQSTLSTPAGELSR